MVLQSYYNPVGMFGRSGTGHVHSHHTSSTQNPYFSNPYNTTPYHHHHHYPHQHNPHPPPSTPNSAVTSTQFSPTVPPYPSDCNHPYQHQIGNMTPESMAAAAAVGWHQPNVNVMYSACASRNMVTGGYDDWTHGHGYPPPPHHSSFYYHQQHSPPNSTPSPHSTHNGGGHQSPNVYLNSQPIIFKSEFGPCSGGNNAQDSGSQEMESGGSSSGGSLVSSVSSSLAPVPTPHSPDSGMAVSDGVSSSGSPATSAQGQQLNPHYHTHLPNNNLNNSMNNQQISNQINTHNNRPTQARSPYEWMKKPTYTNNNTVQPGGGKTRTKDKYRVVYTDNQRLELEKEFHFSRYITIRRKSELALNLGLSERQVKIWFQNRRAKDRKTVRKQDEMKVATMVHNMQNATLLSGGHMNHPGNGLCNQGPLM